MTVRLHLHDRQELPRRSTRWLEYAFLLCGLIAVDSYIWVNVNESYSQVYDNWSLNRQIERQTSATDRHPPAVTPKPNPSDLIGRIEIPRLGLSATVREGVDASTLRRAVGHMPSSALPGSMGNVAFAAHRDTLFQKLRDIHKSDAIRVETPDSTFEYSVESMRVVQPSDVSVLDFEKGDQLLTLITCYPFNYIGAAPNRFIVRARQINVTARTARSQHSETGS